MPTAATQLKKPDALQVTATLTGAVCLFYVCLSWCLRTLLGWLLSLAGEGGAPEWATWLCNFAIAAFCLAAAYFALRHSTPRALQVNIRFAVVRDVRLLLFVPVFLGVVMVANVANSAFSTFLQNTTSYKPSPSVALPHGFGAMTLCFLTMCVVPAVLEEMLVRGLLQQMFMRWGTWFAIVVSGVAFTLLHGDVGQMPGIFIISVMLGLIAYCTRSLTAGIVLHFFNNFISFILLLVEQRLGDKSLIAFGAFVVGILVFLALVSIVLINQMHLMRIFAPVPRVYDAKNRQSRVLRLAKTPVYIACMVLLTVRALLPLWLGGAA